MGRVLSDVGPRVSAPTNAARLELLRWMIRARALDERLVALYRSGGIRGGSVFTGRGQEAFSAAGAMQLREGDVFAPLIRDSAGRLVRGETPLDALRVCLGRKTGVMRGRDGNIHRGTLGNGVIPMISHLGSTIGVIAGLLLAKRLRGERDAIGLVSIGDGGMNTGAFHEGFNVLAVERLPVVLMVADNQLSYSTFSDRSYACTNLVERAAGYGVRGHTCDGTDADACLTTLSEAAARVRAGEGPQMVVAKLLRLAGHGEHDDAAYVTADMKARFGDNVPLFEQKLQADGVLSADALATLWSTARADVATALTQAQSEPEPLPAQEDWSAYSVRDLLSFKAVL